MCSTFRNQIQCSVEINKARIEFKNYYSSDGRKVDIYTRYYNNPFHILLVVVFEILDRFSMAQRGGVFISHGKNAAKVTVHTFRFGFQFFILFIVHPYAYFSVEKMLAK